MKRLICLLVALGVLLSMGIVFGAEAPEAPDVEGLEPEAANELIDEYNQSIEEYNATIDAEYEAAVAEVEAHNAEVDEAVAENEAALQAQEKLQATMESDAARGITENRTDAVEEVPTDWEEEPSEELKTIVVEEAEEKSGEEYKVVNIHLYMDEEFKEGVYDGTLMPQTTYIDETTQTYSLDESVKAHTALAEWEVAEVDKNDVVTTTSASPAMGYRSAAFYKRFEGYTNGYWTPAGTEFASTAVYSETGWDRGATQEFSYVDGTTDGHPIKDVLSVYFYYFMRTGAEPEKVEPMEADYWDMPEKGAYLSPMEKVEPQPEPEPEPQETPMFDPVLEPDYEPEPEPEAVEPTVEPIPEPTPEPAPASIVEDYVPAPTPRYEVTSIEPQEVPEATPEEELPVRGTPMAQAETIEEIPIPLANAVIEEDGKGWALINLIAMVLTALALLKFNERKYNVFSVLIAVASILFFVFTENTENPMVLVDKWTVYMVVGYIVEVVSRFFGKKDKEEEEPEESK